jgi:hypothetical protein
MRRMPLWLTVVTGLSVVVIACAQNAKPEPATQPAVKAPEAVNGTLTKAQEDELMAFLKKMESEQFVKLQQIKEVNPATYQSTAKSWYFWMLSIKRYPESVQKAYVVQQESYTRIYRTINDLRTVTDDTQRKALIEQLRGAVAQLFDAQMTAQGQRLAQLEQQLQQLRGEYETNKANRDKKIDDLLEKFMSASQPSVQITAPALPTTTTNPAK